MAMNQNAKDTILLLLVVGQSGLLGYKISKWVTGKKLEKKLQYDINTYDDLYINNLHEYNTQLREVSNEPGLTEDERSAKLHRLAVSTHKCLSEYYSGAKSHAQDLLASVRDICDI